MARENCGEDARKGTSWRVGHKRPGESIEAGHLLLSKTAQPSRKSKPELLHGVFAGEQLGSDDADSSKHREAAIVQLPGAHLHVVLPQAKRVPEIARLLRGVLGPNAELQRS